MLPARAGEGCAAEVVCQDSRFGIDSGGGADSSGLGDGSSETGSDPEPPRIGCFTGTTEPSSGSTIGGRAFDCKWTEGASTMTCRCGVGTNPYPSGGSQVETFDVPQTTAPTPSRVAELWKTRCCGGDFCPGFDSGGGTPDAPTD